MPVLINNAGMNVGSDSDSYIAGNVGDAASNGVSQAAKAELLFGPKETHDLRSQWERIQGSFVDEPKAAVQEADRLVSATIQRLSEIFTNERARLEQDWDKNEQASTEDLRMALRRYRSFFDRLLSI